MTKNIEIASVAEMARLGQVIGRHLTGGIVIGLVGSLGVGKTTLTKAVLDGLKTSQKGFSPTFVLDAVYQMSRPDLQEVHHLDLYRLKDRDELITLGLADLLAEPKVALLIEWADLFPVLPKNEFLRIKILSKNNNERHLSLEAQGQLHTKLLENISAELV